MDSSIIKVDENSIVKILQSRYDLESFDIHIQEDENIKSNSIDLNELDLILLNILNNNEKIIYTLLLIASKFVKNNIEEIYVSQNPQYFSDFNKYALKRVCGDSNSYMDFLIEPNILQTILTFFSKKNVNYNDILELKIVIKQILQHFGVNDLFEVDNHKSKLLLHYIYHNNSKLPQSYLSYCDFLRARSDINQEFSNLDNFIFQNRPDVVSYCSQPIFDFDLYQKWLFEHGLAEYNLHNFLNEQLILIDNKFRSENKLLINCRDFKSNGLAKLRTSLVENFREIESESGDSGIIFSIGGALEFSEIYPLNIFADKQRKKVAIWVWELNSISAKYVKHLHNFDEIWTLSADSRHALKILGIPSRIVRFPLTIRNNFLPVSEEHRRYFLTFADFASDFNRKNPISAVSAFQQAFESEQDIYLVVKVSNSANDLENYSLLQEMCRLDNRIVLINKILNDQEIFNLFYNCLAFISGHRAEGLGLNIIAAISHLKPAIISKFSAPTEYLPDSYYYFVTGDLIPIHVNSIAYIQPGAKWFNPNVDEIVKLLKEIYQNHIVLESINEANNFMNQIFGEDNEESLKNLLRELLNNLDIKGF